MIDFEIYLQSLVSTYEHWWELYALTDAIGKIRAQKQEQTLSSPFDFGLTVQTVSQEKEQASSETVPFQEKQEKTQRLPVLEGIRKYMDDHVLLIGRPGSGKSTALIRLLLEMATQALEQSTDQIQIPVLVELRYWQMSILDSIRAFLHKHDPYLELDDDALMSLLHQGYFLLLIDGLNELPSEIARTQLFNFRQDYSKVPMIFTTRDLSLGGDLGVEKKLEMQPLTEGQMKEFICAYVPDQAEAMLQQLNDRLREFGQTPLLLWMLCEVFQQSLEHQMPSNLAGIFQAFTTMYEDSSVRKHEVALLKGDVRPLSDRRLWKSALKALASVMMQGETPVDFRVALHRDEAERELSRFFPNEKTPLRDILDDLLKYHLVQNRSADQIEFRHQLIQEYYAAEWLLGRLESTDDETLACEYLNYLKWTEPLALMMALVVVETLAVRVVKQALAVDLMLGARLAREMPSKFKEKAVELVNQIEVEAWLRVKLLGQVGSESSISELVQTLEHPDLDLHRSAAEALGKMGSEAAIPGLLKALERSDWAVRGSAVEALGRFDSKVVISGLFKALGHSAHDVRHDAVRVLRETGSSASIPALIQAIKDVDPNIRRDAAKALRKIGHNTAIPEILKGLENSSGRLYGYMLEALSWIGFDSDIVLDRLLESVKSSDIHVRRSATKGLAEIATILSDEAVSTLVELAVEDSDYSVRANAIRGLGKSRADVAIYALVKVVAEDTDYDLRIEAIQSLGKAKSEISITTLFNVIEEIESLSYIERQRRFLFGVKEFYAIALSELRSSESNSKRNNLNAVMALLYSVYVSLRVGEPVWIGRRDIYNYYNQEAHLLIASVEALGEIRSSQATPKLLKLINSSYKGVNWSAVEALGKIDSNEAFLGLLNALKSADQTVRLRAAIELGDKGNHDAIPALIEATRDSSSSVRFRAAIALVQLGSNAAAIPILFDSLESNEVGAEHASYALGFVKDKCAAHILPNLLTLLPTKSGKEVLEAIQGIQSNCKFYNYEIYQKALQRKSTTDIRDNSKLLSGNTINVHGDYVVGDKTKVPNATQVKIFEQIDHYHATPSPTKEPPS